MLNIKILSLGSAERYALRRLVVAAQTELLTLIPRLHFNISEVNEADQIGRYVTVLVRPSLVINEKVVCRGRFPCRDEIVGWLREACSQTDPGSIL